MAAAVLRRNGAFTSGGAPVAKGFAPRAVIAGSRAGVWSAAFAARQVSGDLVSDDASPEQHSNAVRRVRPQSQAGPASMRDSDLQTAVRGAERHGHEAA